MPCSGSRRRARSGGMAGAPVLVTLVEPMIPQPSSAPADTECEQDRPDRGQRGRREGGKAEVDHLQAVEQEGHPERREDESGREGCDVDPTPHG